jgi:signal transduction histidine kinase
MDLRRPLPLRSKFLLTVLAGAVIPLGLLGLWLTQTAVRSGEELLHTQLSEFLRRVERDVSARWIHRRSDLLLMAENDAVLQALRPSVMPAQTADTLVLGYLHEVYATLEPAVESVRYYDARGTPRWILATHAPVLRVEAGGDAETARVIPASAQLPVRLDIRDPENGARLGRLEAHVRLSSLFSSGAKPTGQAGAVFAVVDRATGGSLLPLPFDPALLAREKFEWNDQPWMVVRHPLADPAVDFAVAAPLNPYTQPFRQAARRGVFALTFVTFGGFAVAVILARRFTQSFEELVEATEAVAQGDLERRVQGDPGDEVGRVALAFNTMTESLRRTLRELSHREALAAVGEFAAILAHEIRNPLTSIRIDLQRVEEKLPEESRLRDPLARALGAVQRLDATVSGSLRVARSGRIHPEPLDLRPILESAMHAARAEFAARGATLEALCQEPVSIPITGDASALNQLFLNLLLNAAQALGAGGRGGIRVETKDQEVTVAIWDTGRGISADELPHVFEPFYTTRNGGTGLGLAVAQRITAAHGGDITIESAHGTGTTVRICLPTHWRATAVA